MWEIHTFQPLDEHKAASLALPNDYKKAYSLQVIRLPLSRIPNIIYKQNTSQHKPSRYLSRHSNPLEKMWYTISLFVPFLLNMSYAINSNSNQEAVRAAIASDTTPFSVDILADSTPPNVSAIYKCVLLKNVEADTQKIKEDPQAAIHDKSPDLLRKRQSSLFDVLMFLAADPPILVSLIG